MLSIMMSRFTWMRNISLMSLIALASCVEKNQMNTTESTSAVLVCKVMSVSALPSRETVNRNRWSISLQVLEIVRGSPSVATGDVVTVQVHSVVKTFIDDASSIVGKTYRIIFNEEFAKDYSGDITVAVEQNQ